MSDSKVGDTVLEEPVQDDFRVGDVVKLTGATWPPRRTSMVKSRMAGGSSGRGLHGGRAHCRRGCPRGRVLVEMHMWRSRNVSRAGTGFTLDCRGV